MSIRNRINRFIKQQKKEARKRYIERQGFLAQQVEWVEKKIRPRVRKYMRLRDQRFGKGRGMDGVMR